MDKLCKYIDKELDELENKVGMGGKLSRADIEDGKNLAKFKMALLTNEAMEGEDYSNEYGGNSYRGSYRGSSYARGRKRDSMGRYSREYNRGEYSRAEAEDEFREHLEEAMQSAPDEHKRKKIERMLNEM